MRLAVEADRFANTGTRIRPTLLDPCKALVGKILDDHPKLRATLSSPRAGSRRSTISMRSSHPGLPTSRTRVAHPAMTVAPSDRTQDARAWNVDPFSTGVLFERWREVADEPLMWRWRDTYDPMFVYRPKTWLLRRGWRRHGLISFHEVPGHR